MASELFWAIKISTLGARLAIFTLLMRWLHPAGWLAATDMLLMLLAGDIHPGMLMLWINSLKLDSRVRLLRVALQVSTA